MLFVLSAYMTEQSMVYFAIKPSPLFKHMTLSHCNCYRIKNSTKRKNEIWAYKSCCGISFILEDNLSKSCILFGLSDRALGLEFDILWRFIWFLFLLVGHIFMTTNTLTSMKRELNEIHSLMITWFFLCNEFYFLYGLQIYLLLKDVITFPLNDTIIFNDIRDVYKTHGLPTHWLGLEDTGSFDLLVIGIRVIYDLCIIF